MPIPSQAFANKPQIAIRFFNCGSGFYLDVTSNDEFRNEFMKMIQTDSRNNGRDSFVSHFAGAKTNGARQCSYDSRSGSVEQARQDMIHVLKISKTFGLEVSESTIRKTDSED